MTEAILEEAYWRSRLQSARQRHHAIFKCPLDEWQRIEEKHREILKEKIWQSDSVLDAGCGWGRLLNLLPENWSGEYVGVDFSPDFIELARAEHPLRHFLVGDLRYLNKFLSVDIEHFEENGGKFDWGILISMRPMVIRNLGQEAWDQMEEQLRRICVDLLFLEYDENDGGEII